MFFASHKIVCRYFLLLFFIPSISWAQNDKTSIPELLDSANLLYEDGRLDAACQLYYDLLTRYPKDGEFNYYTGVCLTRLNRDIPRAINYLSYASSQAETPDDVHYYLGQAYQKNYQFKKAKNSLFKFDQLAKGKLKRKLEPDKFIEMLNNDIEYTGEYIPVKIHATSLFNFTEKKYTDRIQVDYQHLKLKADCFGNESSPATDLTSFTFCPEIARENDYIYFSGYTHKKRKNADIFRVKRLQDNQWDVPERIDIVSSKEDEILPWYDKSSRTLYFASKGHNCMGGYDIFKSSYIEEDDSWTEPVNLGFPLNSVDNEYLALPYGDDESLLLITDRQRLDSMLTLYVLTPGNEKKSFPEEAGYKEIMQKGELGGISAIHSIFDFSTRDFTGKSPARAGKQSNSGVPADLQHYNSDLTTALSFQKKSDSLSMLAKQNRIHLKSLSDPDEKWDAQKKIINWEKLSGVYINHADAIFIALEKAREAKEKELAQASEIPVVLEKDREVEGTEIYKFKPKEKSETKKEAPVLKKVAEPGKTKTPSPSTGIAPNKPAAKGADYRIQIGAFKNAVNKDHFKELDSVFFDTQKDQGITRYYTGPFSIYENARNSLSDLKARGFRDAFIVSWYDGVKTSLNKVRQLEERDHEKK